METRYSLDDLPLELIETQFVPRLENNDIAHAMMLSRRCLSMFNHADSWKMRIAIDFGIPLDVLGLFANEVKKIKKTEYFNFEFLYHQLRHVIGIENILPNYLRYSYRDPLYYYHLLTCCFNDAECARQLLPPSEDVMWIQLALYAEFNNIAELIDRSLDQMKIAFFMYAVKAGNLGVGQALFAKHEREKEFVFDGLWVEWAAESGKLPALKWVLELGGEQAADYVRNNNDDILYLAGLSGSIEMMEYLADTYDLQGDDENISGVLMSGNESAITWFCQRFSLPPLCASYFYDMIHSRNLSLLNRMMMTFDKKPTYLDCTLAAKTGDVSLYKAFVSVAYADSLADKDESIYGGFLARFHSQMMQSDLISAAKSGNPALVDYCMSEFQLECDRAVFLAAIESGNVLLCERLRKQFRFNLDDVPPDILSESGNLAVAYWGNMLTQRQNLIDALSGRKTDQVSALDEKDREKLFSQLRLPLLNFAADALLYPEEYSLNEEALKIVVGMIHYLATQASCTLIERHTIRLLLQDTSEALAQQKRSQLAEQLENLHIQLQDKDALRPALKR